MNNRGMYFLGVCILAAAGMISLLHAQSFGAYGIGPIAPTVSGCPSTSATVAMLCPVGSGTSFQMYVSYNGGAYAPLTTGGVTSFNGRSGVVVSVANDYSYAQLSSPPTSVTAGTFSVTNATIK